MTVHADVSAVGVDGCRTGWVAAFEEGGSIRIAILPDISAVLAAFPAATIAIDMPIGLPDRIVGPGRGPEQALRPKLGARQSSVFSVPSRAAVEAGTYAEACQRALETSTPPRKVSKQAFNLFPKILQIDAALRSDPAARPRVFEVHPEGAFWHMNGGVALRTPKKQRDHPVHAVNRERFSLLERESAVPDVFRIAGALADDILDACACLVVARRILRGEALVFPDRPARDALGLEIAIRV